MSRTSKDVLSVVESNTLDSVEILKNTTKDSDMNKNVILKSILSRLEIILDEIALLRQYRTLSSKTIFIYDTRTSELRESTKSEKIKICRNMLKSAGFEELEDK